MKIFNKNVESKLSLTTSIVVATLLFSLMESLANAQVSPFLACDADWDLRSDFSTISSIAALHGVEKDAERTTDPNFPSNIYPKISPLLRLGMVRKTRDGKWTAPSDGSYNTKWLKKAEEMGSKSATWELASIRYRTTHDIKHEDYLRAAIVAAEEEGNPWAATFLLYRAQGGWSEMRFAPTSCLKEWTPDGKCAPPELLPRTSASKWAEIAAEGGNAAAQQWLCLYSVDGRPEWGVKKDEEATKKWCEIASYNLCASSSIGSKSVKNQSWRGSWDFFLFR